MSNVKEIAKILARHKGKENAISAGEIHRQIYGVIPEATHSQMRGEIKRGIESGEIGLPALSCNRGYYVAANEQEKQQYRDELDVRIKGIEARKDLVK